MEVTGSVNLADKFPGPVPPDGEQDQFVKDACTKLTDDYLAPVTLRKTTLTLIYSTISLPSWTAGSKQVSCSIGATLGNGGWSTLLMSAKGQLMINGSPPAPVPDIPAERLDLPPIPLPPVDTSSQVSTQIDMSGQGSSSNSSSSSSQTPQGNDHLPNQQQPGPAQTQGSTAPTSSGAVPPPGNTFLNGPPPGVGDGQPQDGPQAPAPAGGDPAAAPPPGQPAPAVGPAPGPAAPVVPGPTPGQ